MVTQIADGMVTTYDWLYDKGCYVPHTKVQRQIAHFTSTGSQTIRCNITTDKQKDRLRSQLRTLDVIFLEEAIQAFEFAFERNMSNEWGNDADTIVNQDGW
jgi:predicted HAD superfamily phosphohydrolase YqeG